MFTLDTTTGPVTKLPFEGGLCRCHPSDNDLCAFLGDFYITIANLSNGSVVREQMLAEEDTESLDMRWSPDGSKLYAACGTGRTYMNSL